MNETIGQVLRSQRQQKKLTVEVVADKLYVPSSYIELIEENKLDELPSEIFAHGYVMSYAKLVNSDLEKIEQLLQNCFPTSQGDDNIINDKINTTQDEQPPLIYSNSVYYILGSIILGLAILIFISN